MAGAKSIYSVHPGVVMVQNWVERWLKAAYDLDA